MLPHRMYAFKMKLEHSIHECDAQFCRLLFPSASRCVQSKLISVIMLQTLLNIAINHSIHNMPIRLRTARKWSSNHGFDWKIEKKTSQVRKIVPVDVFVVCHCRCRCRRLDHCAPQFKFETKLLTFRFVCVSTLPVQISFFFFLFFESTFQYRQWLSLFFRFVIYSQQFTIWKMKTQEKNKHTNWYEFRANNANGWV